MSSKFGCLYKKSLKIKIQLLFSALAFLLTPGSFAQTLKLGKVKFLNSGSPAAQEAFLDGVAALHCFWYTKAFEKFREAQKADPTFGMAYWGEVMTFNHPVWNHQDFEGGRAALKRFGKTSEARAALGKTETEKTLIQSLDMLFGDGTKTERDQSYSKLLESLYNKNKNDIEIVSFYALSVLGTVNAYEGNFKKQLKAAKAMEDYLQVNNSDALDHPGLLHYLIHAYDHPSYAKRAIQFANLYSRVSPDSSHALHMPSHIYLQLGIWDRVVEANDESYQTSIKWAKRDKTGESTYDFHSLYWLHYGYLQQGRVAEAKAVLSQMRKIADAYSLEDVQGYYGMMRARFSLETGESEDLAIPTNLKESAEKLENNAHAGCVGAEGERNRISTVLAIGMGAAQAGSAEVTQKALESVQALKKQYSDNKGGFDQKILDITNLQIGGVFKLNSGSKVSGLALLKSAAVLEGRLDPPPGPPIPAKPATELYAEALLKQGDAKEALVWFKKSLSRTPNRTLSLAGAYHASKKLGDKGASGKYGAILKRILVKADASFKQRLGLSKELG